MSSEERTQRIERFEDIDPPPVWRVEAWQLARELTHKIYGLTKKVKFAHDLGLKGQIQDTAGSSIRVQRFKVRGY